MATAQKFELFGCHFFRFIGLNRPYIRNAGIADTTAFGSRVHEKASTGNSNDLPLLSEGREGVRQDRGDRIIDRVAQVGSAPPAQKKSCGLASRPP